LREISDFLWVLRFPSPIKLTATILTEILLEVALNTINQTKTTNLSIQKQIFCMGLSKEPSGQSLIYLTMNRVIDTDYIGSRKSNYHTIMTTNVPVLIRNPKWLPLHDIVEHVKIKEIF
jgi:energy-coupling factor transporter ATP-binding protein EcfA2